MNKEFTIVIATKDRLAELKITLQKITRILEDPRVICIICDDGSTDGTGKFLKTFYPNITQIRNAKSLGLMATRNRLMAMVTTPFAISIDDDLHFITADPLTELSSFFALQPDAAVVGFRTYWNPEEPNDVRTMKRTGRMQSYIGGAHAFRMDAWRQIRPYPEWFLFYGEEDFASFQLFRLGWKIYYLPGILVNHRVDLPSRRNDRDYLIRRRRNLRAGWYLQFLFYPTGMIPGRLAYSIWTQLKLKVLKGDFRTLLVLFLAALDVFVRLPRLYRERQALSTEQFKDYEQLPPTEIYWKEGD